MDLRGDKPVYFATDLTNFLACRHLTALERLAAHKLAKRPFFDDPMLEVLRERGLAHERAYVDHLARSGARVVEIDKNAGAFDKTLEAMHGGADVIVQARLEDQGWAGWADVLLRVAGESRLGAWRYEPVETKLAKETRGATLIQLCLYAELLTAIQGSPPALLRVVVPEAAFTPESFRFAEFQAYFRLVRRNFEAELQKPLGESAETALPYPEPVGHCDICNWYTVCESRWTKDDHVSRVAGILKTQRKELGAWGVTTLRGLAEVPLPLPRKPSRGSVAALERAREQARLQLEARTTGKPVYELLAVEEAHGLAALPEPSALDIFLDLEGDRLAQDGGLDYLFGYVVRDAVGSPQYEAVWAVVPSEEKQAFGRLMDLIVAHRRRDTGMHVYHYAPYEPTAFRRLMGRYATRADELDELLRNRVFVDLYSVLRRGLRAGVDSYSIKRLEPFYGLAREVDLRQAGRHRRAVEYAIARKDAASLTPEVRDAVRLYNRDDCLSALGLRDWLEGLRAETVRSGTPVPRPGPPIPKVTEELKGRQARIRELADALTAELPVERDRVQDAQWTLAQLLEWHRREDNAGWWEYFRLNELPPDELVDERDGIGGLCFSARLETTKRGTVIDRYEFPPQDTDLEPEDEAFAPGSDTISSVGEVEAIDVEHRTVDLRKGKARAEQHPTAVFRHDNVRNEEAVEALLRLAEFVRDHGVDGVGAHQTARDLLLRRNPRLIAGAVLREAGEGAVASARRLGLVLDGGVLAIQGPPGAGKTFTGARMILDLVRAGKKVGVTAGSHKVIRNLLDEIVRAAAQEQASVRCMHRVQAKSKNAPLGIDEETDSKKAVTKILNREYDVVGGTAWVWPKKDVAGAIDVLVVDEAGQMSLANVLACSQAATNLVLLGDPQQLEQPQKASHPDGSELSALEYLLEGHDTMPEDRGLFLTETWRLHPSICSYTSELFYESKLQPHPSLDTQLVSGPTPYAGTGLFYVPVAHEGNQNSSPEEAGRIADIVTGLIAPGVTWMNRHGESKAVTLDDVLIVAPYNAQVSEIAQLIPGGRIGTVDKFQGQEAPIVIYSMTTSSSEEAPHGMEFLFSRHRMNVATSRARCVCILVGNPQLFEPHCRTPEQMRMANAFCRYLEMARVED
jgi:predicted RecB family nuclease